MYFKAKFLDNKDIDHYLLDETENSAITGKEILNYKQYEFEIERNNEGFIDGITFCNQCVNTYGIESEFMKLLLQLLPTGSRVKLFDSNGLTSDFDCNELEEYIV